MSPEPTVRCIGCGGLVPDVDGPSHRYMLASPGCWAAYTEFLAFPSRPRDATSTDALAVDAYAVQHPGIANQQAAQSVWVHLIAIHLVLERDWPAARLVHLRRYAADSSTGWPWLEPPTSMGDITAIDVARADPTAIQAVARAWVSGAWDAWSARHEAVRARAETLIARLD